MPAPTALRRQDAPQEDHQMDESAPLPAEEQGELLDMQALPQDQANMSANAAGAQQDDMVMTDESGRPRFAPASATPIAFRRELRKVPIPPHRMTPLKNEWPKYVSLPFSICLLHDEPYFPNSMI